MSDDVKTYRTNDIPTSGEKRLFMQVERWIDGKCQGRFIGEEFDLGVEHPFYMDMSDEGVEYRLTLVRMTEVEVAALPEFQGW